MDDEADFEGDLPVMHLPLVDVATGFDDLEPTEAFDGLVSAFESLVDGILNGGGRGSCEFDDLIDVVFHDSKDRCVRELLPWGEHLLMRYHEGGMHPRLGGVCGVITNGPVGGAEGASHAGRHGPTAIKMAEPDALPEGDGRLFTRDRDEIANALGSVAKGARHGAVRI